MCDDGELPVGAVVGGATCGCGIGWGYMRIMKVYPYVHSVSQHHWRCTPDVLAMSFFLLQGLLLQSLAVTVCCTLIP